MKVVINKCYGGFSLSRAAVRRLAELQGRPCYFFRQERGEERYIPLGDDEERVFLWWAFDVPNPDEVIVVMRRGEWHRSTPEERQAYNERFEAHEHDSRPRNRADPLLVQVVEELGERANGDCAKLAVVEIPDGVEWEISEYDGREQIAEKHRTWG